MCACLHHVCACAYRVQQREPDNLDMELQVVVSDTMWVLITKLWSSSVLNC